MQMKTITPHKKQLAIDVAKDVIKTLRSSIVETSSYVSTSPSSEVTVQKLLHKYHDDSKTLAKKLRPHCKVCALGACLLSVVSLKNEFVFDVFNGDIYVPRSQIVKRLKGIFSKRQLALIESAFEGYLIYLGNRPSEKSWEPDLYRAVHFGKSFSDPKLRLKAIMENVIANNGVFKP